VERRGDGASSSVHSSHPTIQLARLEKRRRRREERKLQRVVT
jgi:hypothetical protein